MSWISGGVQKMGKYATLRQILFDLSTMTYHIFSDGILIDSNDSKAIAYANFRNYCRIYENKPCHVELRHDNELLSCKPAKLQLLEDNDGCTCNEILQTVLNRLNIDVVALKTILKDSKLALSSSRIDGWFRKPNDRKYMTIHHDELSAVLDLVLQYTHNNIKTPQNIKALRKKLGLTQSELAEMLGLKSGFRQVARWESGEQEMPDSRWRSMQKLNP